MKKIISLFALLCALVSPSISEASVADVLVQQDVILTQDLIDWKVGDRAEYALKAGFLTGTVVKEVSSDTGEAIWVVTNLNALIMKQKIETLIRKSDGKILEVKIDGKPQSVPESDEIIVVEQKYEKIEVPAGIFPCLYVKFNTKDVKGAQVWISEETTTMENAVKTVLPSQIGEVTIELTKYHKVD